jgi:hypothetical protein
MVIYPLAGGGNRLYVAAMAGARKPWFFARFVFVFGRFGGLFKLGRRMAR